MSKLLATTVAIAAIGMAGLIAAPAANADERNAAGMSNVRSTDISAAKRHTRRHYRHHAWRHYRYRYGYYHDGPHYAYGYDPYYYRPGPSFYVGPGGFGFGWR